MRMHLITTGKIICEWLVLTLFIGFLYGAMYALLINSSTLYINFNYSALIAIPIVALARMAGKPIWP